MAVMIIIGGGIGGLAAAAALHRFGIEAHVYERAATLTKVGAAIGLWPNATRALRHLGVLDELMKCSHIAPAAALRDQSGRILRQMAQLETDAPTLFTHRATLHAALLAAVPASHIHLDKAFAHLDTDGEKIRASFADGSNSPWCEGLIGADGINSTVRRQLLNDGGPRYRGHVAWRGVAEFVSDGVVGETLGRGRRFGIVPLGGDRTAWWATANTRSPEETLRQKPGEWKRDVLRLFARWHAPICDVVRATSEQAVLCDMIADRPPSPHWGKGTATLLGDAAHPTTPNLGQGGCMAIEDAAVLARAVHAVPNLASALRVYEATRRERTTMIVRESRKMGRMGQWESRPACLLRNFAMRHAPGRRFQKMFEELWAHDAWTTPLVMPF